MRKTIILFAVIVAGFSNVSAQKGKKAEIKSESDSVSYAYGISLVQQGMLQFLQQQGVLGDTAQVNNTYKLKIDAETDLTKKAALKKEQAFKIDSINAKNKVNLPLFVKGLNESLEAKPEKSVYLKGISLGAQINDMLPSLVSQIYGQDSSGEINKPLLQAGLTDALSGKTSQIENAVGVIEKKVKDEQVKEFQKKESENEARYAEYKKAGQDFLEHNAQNDSVAVSPMGWQYKVITQGSGPKPKATDRVKVHYTGSLIDGTVFDSSIQRGEPIVLGVGQVIQGWTEALKAMPVGSKWMVYIPYELGYGTRGAGAQIKPYSTLIFEMELLDIEK